MLQTYLNDFSSSALVKIYHVKFNLKLLNKNQIFGSHVVVLVKTFPLMYAITNVGLISAKPGRLSFLGFAASRGTNEIQFQTLLKKNANFGAAAWCMD